MRACKVRVHTLPILCIILLSLILTPALNTVNVYGKNTTFTGINLSASTVPVGGTVIASATITGVTATQTGSPTVTYLEFSGNACSGPSIDSQVVIVSNGYAAFQVVIPNSSPKFLMGSAGTFSFHAVYSGDVNNLGSTSTCRPVTVTRTATTTTTLSAPPIPATIPLGGSITDTATLSGVNVGTGTGGTVVYTLYTGIFCTGPAAATSVGTVTNGVAASSAPFIPTVQGTYSIRAVYSGDAKNLASASPCETPVTVGKSVVTIMTTIVPASPITAGTPVHDTATLGSATSTAGGTVTYTLFPNGACTGTGQTSTVTVKNAVVPASSTFTLNNVGPYSFGAVYSGDKNNAGATATCEPLTVNQAVVTITTGLATPITILAGQTVTDTATLTGATSNAGGTVTYSLFRENTCVTVIDTSTVTVTNDVVPPSKAFVISDTSHIYGMEAVYNGDSNNKPSLASSCEQPIDVNQATPTVITQVSPPPIFTDGSVTDQATLVGSSGSNAGGTVTFNMYNGASCSGSSVGSATETVTNGIVPPTGSFFIPGQAAGTYSFKAVYNGDSNNKASAPTCEVFTAVKHTPILLTQISPNPDTYPGPVTDTATFTGLSTSTAPTGSVTFNMYSGSTCSGSSIGSATIAIANVITTGSFSVPSTGTFSFSVSYPGDTNNMAVSTCELLTVTKTPVSITTQLTPTTIFVGQTTTDTATLTGFASGAGGSITFTLYSGSSCSGPTLDTFTTGVTSGVENSNYMTPAFNAGGPYSVIAVYSGDGNNAGATSPCELLTVAAQPTLTTSLVTPTIEAVQPATDSAILSGATATAGGSVFYYLYPASCVGTQLDAISVTVTNAIVPKGTFPASDIMSAGTFGVRAHYTGDSFNLPANSACETLTVVLATSSISTKLSATTIFGDEGIMDSATLSGVTNNATGHVTYTLYAGTTCTTPIPGQTDTEVVTNGIVPPTSGPLMPGAPGTIPGQFGVEAVYNGDVDNLGSHSSCEVFNVVVHTPSISTALGASSISFGSGISDSATLKNAGPTAGGTVTYNLYANGACTGSIVPGQTDTETVTNGVVPSTSGPLTPNNPGSFGIQAVYSGDANNLGAKSACEPFTVKPISISTKLSATTVSTAGTISDSATLNGVTSNAGGTVAYTLYAGGTCSGPSQFGTGPLTVTNGIVPDSGTVNILDLLTPPTGPFSFQAVYSGDANNAGAKSPCEPFSVVQASTSVATLLSATTIDVGDSVNDTATLSGAAPNAGGTVKFTMYTGGTCTGTVVGTDTETVTNDFVPTTGQFGASTPGTYSFQAVYSGDTGNKPSKSPCNEILTVTTIQKASPSISTQLSFSSITVFNTVTDTAILTGATSNAGGTVTFSMYNGASCSGSSIGSDTETVTNGIVPTTGQFAAPAVGFFSFKAVYTGDVNNNGATSSCEILTVTTATPTLSILLSATTIIHGGSVTVSSALAGATSNASGSVVITMYKGGACSGSSVGTDTETVTNGIIPTSGKFFASTAGTYSFHEVYGGDANNAPTASACVILTAT